MAARETEIITEEDAKSEDESKESEETNEEERETRWEYTEREELEHMSIQMFLLPKRKEAAYKKLYEGIVKRDMDLVNDVLDTEEVSVTDVITNNGNTALHVAVGTSNDSEFFEELLEKTPKTNKELKDLQNSDGSTLLHIAATVGNIEAAEFLMDKYPDMLYKTNNKGQTPLVVALSKHSNFYWSFSKKGKYMHGNMFSGISTDELLVLAISYKDFELATNLIRWRCKMLNSDAVLMAIAQNYPTEISFWERRAEDYLPQLLAWGASHTIRDTIVTQAIWLLLPFVKKTVEKRANASEVLRRACEKIERSSDHKKYYTNPVLEATRRNALDVVKRIVFYFPNAFWSETEDGHNVIQYAVINRSEKIYNLLYHMSEHRNVYKTIKDATRNNLLHLAARLAPAEKLNLISGAALQIQYELQWYEEVENFVCPLNITEKNSLEETPQMVFMREHQELLSAGAQWMKSTAKSYSITTTLITTVVFAAGITVPGGNNQDTGIPIFTNNPAFTIFAVSVAISLFTGVMSLLMFLSILTARFAVKEFLHKLPQKLIIGLVTLFISTTTMIIAFGASLFIVFGQNNRLLLIPIGALTGLTITFFVTLQFPLVRDLIRATYGRSIFGRNVVTTDDMPFNI